MTVLQSKFGKAAERDKYDAKEYVTESGNLNDGRDEIAQRNERHSVPLLCSSRGSDVCYERNLGQCGRYRF